MRKSKEVEVIDLRNTLKSIISDELNNLPGILQGLEPEKRISYVIKLMPYVFPKVEGVYMKVGEPDYENNSLSWV